MERLSDEALNNLYETAVEAERRATQFRKDIEDERFRRYYQETVLGTITRPEISSGD